MKIAKRRDKQGGEGGQVEDPNQENFSWRSLEDAKE